MFFRIAADAVLVLHLTFILFAVVGAAFALRWHWIPYVHLPAAAWAVFVELSGRICPLTPLENYFRERAGDSGYDGGFIEHYLVSLIYPTGLTRELQYLLAAVVLLTNLSLYAFVLLRRTRANETRKQP